MPAKDAYSSPRAFVDAVLGAVAKDRNVSPHAFSSELRRSFELGLNKYVKRRTGPLQAQINALTKTDWLFKKRD